MAQLDLDQSLNTDLGRQISRIATMFEELYAANANTEGTFTMMTGFVGLLLSPAAYSETPADIAAVLVSMGVMQPNF